MKYIIVVLLALFPAVSFAYPNAPDNRAMGGILSQDIDNPAISSFNPDFFHFTALSVDVRFSLSEGLKTYSWMRDFIDLKNNLNSITDVLTRKNQIVDILSRAPSGLSALPRVDLLSFIVGNERSGKFHFGIFGSGFTAVKIAAPNVNNITINGSSIDMGQETNLLTGMGLGDAGLHLGYGRKFKLPKNTAISFGVINRTFYRFNVPTKVFRLGRYIDGSDNISVPDFSYDSGFGTAFDLSVAFHLNDRVFNTLLFGYVENIFSKIWIGNGDVRDRVMGTIGALIHPLHKIKNDHLGIGMDFKIYEDVVGLNTGVYYRLEKTRWLNFIPRVGFMVNDKDLFYQNRHAFTCGFGTMLGVVMIAPSFEYFTNGSYDVGIRFALGN